MTGYPSEPRIYFDHNASAPLRDAAREAMIAALEEPTRMTRCVGAQGCVAENRCLTHGLWFALGQNIEAFLARVTIADVINDSVPGDEAGNAARRINGHAVAAPPEHAP